MSQVSIQHVQTLPLNRQPIAEFILDQPVAGQQFDGHALDVVGWLIHQQTPVHHIEIQHGPEVIRQVEAWIPLGRRRIWKAMVESGWSKAFKMAFQLGGKAVSGVDNKKGAGFHGSVGVLGLPRDFELQVVAVLENGARAPVATLRGQRTPLQPRYQPQRRPLLMTHLGRSGSTWLAHLLAEHPEVIVHRRYPHEAHAAIHTLRVLQALTTPTNAVRQRDLEDLYVRLDHAYAMPLFCQEDDPRLHQWMRQGYVERHAEFSLQMIDAFYDEVAAAQGKPDARYFCEKMFLIPLAAGLCHDLYGGAKEIFLVRDFRDVICSHKSFVGRQSGSPVSFNSLLKETAGKVAVFQQAWAERGQHGQLIRYEDLVRQPGETLKTILAYLELDHAPALIAGMIERAAQKDLQQHLTAADPLQSIGRWRQDLPREFHALTHAELGDSLGMFGYAGPGKAAA